MFNYFVQDNVTCVLSGICESIIAAALSRIGWRVLHLDRLTVRNYWHFYTCITAASAWHQMVPICTEWWCTEANEATQTHCYNPVAPAYPIWAYYAHGQQSRCQEDPVSLPSGRLEKTTRSSPHHVAQHRPTGSETSPPYAPRSSRFGSEPPSVDYDVDVWRYAIVSCTPETTTTITGPTVITWVIELLFIIDRRRTVINWRQVSFMNVVIFQFL